MPNIASDGSGNLQEPIANFNLQGVITPAALTANTDNYNPTGLQNASVIVLSDNAAGPYNLTGIVAQAYGKMIMLVNTAAENIVLKHNVTSTAANRFFGPNSADVTLRPNGWVFIWYDQVNSRWRIMGA